MDGDQLVPAWQLSDGELTAALLSNNTTINQAHGRMLTLVSEADSRGLASSKGYRNTTVFLATAMNLSPREAKARVAHATTPMPLTGKALSEGSINPEHVALIHKVLSQAPKDLDDDLRMYAEKTLVDLAVQAPPRSVRDAGDRLLAYWDIDSKKPKDPLAEPKRRLLWRFDKAGQIHFSGELDPETAALLTGIIEPLAKSRPVDEFGREDTRGLDERQGDALAELIHLATRAPDLPTAGTERALITVTISLEELECRAGTAFIEGIGYTSVAHLRRPAAKPKSSPRSSAPAVKSSTSARRNGPPWSASSTPSPSATAAAPDPAAAANLATVRPTMSRSGSTTVTRTSEISSCSVFFIT